jgi:hypothetical protein
MIHSEGIQVNPGTDAALVDSTVAAPGTYTVRLYFSCTVAASARFVSAVAPNAILIATDGPGSASVELGKTVFAASATLDVLLNAGVSGDAYAAVILEPA